MQKARGIMVLFAALFSLVALLWGAGHKLGSKSTAEARLGDVRPDIQQGIADILDKNDLRPMDSRQMVMSSHVDAFNNALFASHKHEVDILVVGDSTLNMGLSEQILAQSTGKRVRILSENCATPDQDLARLTQSLADRYLAPDGIMILVFAKWVWEYDQTGCGGMTSLNRMAGLRPSEMYKFLEKMRPKANYEMFSSGSYKQYLAALFTAVHQLPGIGAISLPEIPFYRPVVEKYYAPELYAKQGGVHANPTTDIDFVWDANRSSRFRVKRDAKKVANQPVNVQTATSAWSYMALERGRIWAKTMRHPTLFVIPLSENHEDKVQIRLFYEQNFSEIFGFIDFTRLVPYGTFVDYQEATHMANLWPARISVAMGHWLKLWELEKQRHSASMHELSLLTHKTFDENPINYALEAPTVGQTKYETATLR